MLLAWMPAPLKRFRRANSALTGNDASADHGHLLAVADSDPHASQSSFRNDEMAKDQHPAVGIAGPYRSQRMKELTDGS